MKQKHKKILGVFGLVLVAAMTIFASSLPSSKTQATASVTDTISVTVVGEEASVKINEDGKRGEASSVLNINVDYGKILTLYVDLSYSDGNTTHNFRLVEMPTGYGAVDSLAMSFDLKNRTYTYNGETHYLPDNFGYGEYSIHAYGYGNFEPKVPTEDYLKFKYMDQGIIVPNTGTITKKETKLMQTDYLITGLVVFLLVGISGFMFVSGKERSTRKRRK